MAKIARARQALVEGEQLREENIQLRARVAELEEQAGAAKPRKAAASKPAGQ